MTQPSETTEDANLPKKGARRFGTGRNFEDLLNEVYRHTSCLVRDLERIQTYLEAVSRKKGSA